MRVLSSVVLMRARSAETSRLVGLRDTPKRRALRTALGTTITAATSRAPSVPVAVQAA